jgi:hypothetical protein
MILQAVAMDGDVKRRMSVWCLLTFTSVLLVIVIGLALFFEPGHGGGPIDKGHGSAPSVMKPNRDSH